MQPNVLLITLDQFRGDSLSCAGHPLVRTPNLDALAADGVRLARHYSQAAPCAPGRASLYTGMYQMNHRVVANGTPLDARFDTLALAGRRAGYRPAVQYLMDHTSDIVSLFAVQREPYSFEGWAVGRHQGLKLFGTPDRTPLSGEYAVRRVRNGSVDLRLTISHTMSLRDYDEALRLIANHQAMKVAFLPPELG